MVETKQKESKMKKFAKAGCSVSLLIAVFAVAYYFAAEVKHSWLLIIAGVLFAVTVFDMIMIAINKNKQDLSILSSVLIMVINIPVFFVGIVIIIADLVGGNGEIISSTNPNAKDDKNNISF